MHRLGVTILVAVVSLAIAVHAQPAGAALVPGPQGFGSPGPEDGAFSNPGGIAYDESGGLWVADTGNGRLQLFTPTGALVKVVPGFTAPTDVAVGPDGAVYVADPAAARVTKLQPDGSVDGSFSATGLPDVRSVAVDPHSDALYVVETAAGEVDQLSSVTGASETVVRTGLRTPTSVAVDESGALAIVEQAAGRVTILDPNGQPSFAGQPGQQLGEFDRPTGVTFDPYGLVVVADTGNGRIQRFTETGTFVDALGGLGAPVDVASDEIQRFAVTDAAGGRVAFADDVLPPPVLGHTANVAKLEGTVTVRLPGQAPRPLRIPEQIQLRAELDTRLGSVRLVTARPDGKTQRATLSKGRVVIEQPVSSGVPTATLSGPELKTCPATAAARRRAGTARLPNPDSPKTKPKRVIRTRVKGKFHTNGNAAAADVKGTEYEVADFCSGTLVTVFNGIVQVTRRADGASTTVRGTLKKKGSIFVKGPVRVRRG